MRKDCNSSLRSIYQGESSTRSLKAPLKVPFEGPLNSPLKAALKAPLKVSLKAPLKVRPPIVHPILCPRRGPSGHPPPGAPQNGVLGLLKGHLKGYLKGSGGTPSMKSRQTAQSSQFLDDVLLILDDSRRVVSTNRIQTHSPTFFCASFFPFFALSDPPFPRQFSSPKSPLAGTSDLFFLVEKRQPAGAGFWGRFWTRSPHRKKGKSFFWRAKKR